LAPLLASFQQAREDLAACTEALTADQIWSAPPGFGTLGFHLRHIAGSTERLMAYLQGRELTPAQMEALRSEKEPGADRDELLTAIDSTFRDAEAVVRAIDPGTLADPRWVGRKRLPTTVIGLLTHIAEHTQRHVGQAIVTARMARRTMEP